MGERPILFSAPMVRALLAGTKSQTRRVVKPQPEHGVERCHYSRTGWAHAHPTGGGTCTCKPIRAPYGVPGDVLWVRENWCAADTPTGFAYMADAPAGSDQRGMGWRPSIHMPRAACRLRLRITDVRVERLQDISEADAVAEGVTGSGDRDVWPPCAKAAYQELWGHINGPGAWADNPFVWAVTFERIGRTVRLSADAMGAA